MLLHRARISAAGALVSISFLIGVLLERDARAQEIIKISDQYSCARFANGTTAFLLNGREEGSYSISTSGSAIKKLRENKKIFRERIKSLEALKSDIKRGKFDKKKSDNLIVQLFLRYFPSEPDLDTREARLNAVDKIITELKGDIAEATALEATIVACSRTAPRDKSVAKYGQRIPIVVRPVIIQPAAAWNYRAAYVGYLLTVAQDTKINDEKGRKIGKRHGYLACAKNLNTNKTFYRIFDDQPCQESEGGENGGNTSLPFADLEACKKLVPKNSWASFGRWYEVSPPTEENIQRTYTEMLANEQPFFQSVFFDADPYRFSGGVSLLKFKSWCASGNAY